MRFLVVMYPMGELDKYIAGAQPDPELVKKMMKFNEEMVKAGVVLDLAGLDSPSRATRVSFQGGKASLKDGPFSESKEVVGGYWILQCKSKEEAVEWARRCPAADGNFIEVRKIMGIEDYAPDVQEAAKSDYLPLKK